METLYKLKWVYCLTWFTKFFHASDQIGRRSFSFCFFFNSSAHYIKPPSVSCLQVGVCTCVILLAALIGNEWPPLSLYCGLSATTPAQNPPLSVHGQQTSSFWWLPWPIRLCIKVNYPRIECGLLHFSVKPTDIVERCSLQTTKQTARWVARQINYSLNCQLPSTGDISFHFHFTSRNPIVWKTAALISQPLITPLLSARPHSHLLRSTLTGPLSASNLNLLSSIVPLGLFRMRWQPR